MEHDPMTPFATTIDIALLSKLDATAAATGHTRDEVIALALESYLNVDVDQIEAIKEGLAQADRGEFVGEADMQAIFAELRMRAKRSPP
jgi:predicted transcriptional regulator